MQALVLNCTLTRSPEPSSIQVLSQILMRQWSEDRDPYWAGTDLEHRQTSLGAAGRRSQ
jgi:hypothetical protein